jgi:hypothetical protein
MPAEIELGHAVDRYGGLAVFGRTIGGLEMRRISLAERVVAAFRARTGDWAVWDEENPEVANLLGLALREAIELGLIDGN